MMEIQSQEQVQERERSRHQAQTNLNDIKELRSNISFNRYFMRKINVRHDEIADNFRHNKVIDKDEREILRRILDELDLIKGYMDIDAGAAQVSLDRTA